MIESKIELAALRWGSDFEKTIKFHRQIRTEDSHGVKIPPTEETEITIIDKSGASLSFWICKEMAFDVAELILGREIYGHPA